MTKVLHRYVYRRRIQELWPLRNEHFGVRMMLRAWIKVAKDLENDGKRSS